MKYKDDHFQWFYLQNKMKQRKRSRLETIRAAIQKFAASIYCIKQRQNDILYSIFTPAFCFACYIVHNIIFTNNIGLSPLKEE